MRWRKSPRPRSEDGWWMVHTTVPHRRFWSCVTWQWKWGGRAPVNWDHHLSKKTSASATWTAAISFLWLYDHCHILQPSKETTQEASYEDQNDEYPWTIDKNYLFIYNIIYIYIIHIYCIYVYIDMKYHYMTCHSCPFYMCESMDFSGNGALCSSKSASWDPEIPGSHCQPSPSQFAWPHDFTHRENLRISSSFCSESLRSTRPGKRTKSYWKWPCRVDLPIKNCDFP